MTTPGSLLRLLLIGYLLLAACNLEARIGETKSQIETRMLNDRNAIEVPKDLMNDALKHRSVIYKWLYELFPSEVEHEFYYKTADSSQASTAAVKRVLFPEGWTLHVVYLRGISVFEAYRRNGDKITDYEVNGILSKNQANSKWIKLDKTEANQLGSVIGVTHKRADDKIRAFHKPPYLIIYDTRFDEAIGALMAKNRAEDDELAKKTVNESLKGF